MSFFSSPMRAFLLLALTFLGQSSALAHACAWSMSDDDKHEVLALLESSSGEVAEPSCHDRVVGANNPSSALDTAPLDVAHLCLCATGGCATAAAMPAHSFKPGVIVGSLGYPALVQNTLNPPLTTPLRPPSFA